MLAAICPACRRYFIPGFLLLLLVVGIVSRTGGSEWPAWAVSVGWLLAIAPLTPIAYHCLVAWRAARRTSRARRAPPREYAVTGAALPGGGDGGGATADGAASAGGCSAVVKNPYANVI